VNRWAVLSGQQRQIETERPKDAESAAFAPALLSVDSNSSEAVVDAEGLSSV